MSIFNKIKLWFGKNKKKVIISGTIVLTIVGTGVGYVIYKNNKMLFPNWLKTASTEDLKEVYKELRTDVYCKTGVKPFVMEKIGQELGERGAKEWLTKHPPNPDPNFRWTDKNRWE